MTKEDCITNGYDLNLCVFHKNGQLRAVREWNNDHTDTYLVKDYHDNGVLAAEFEWNFDHSITYCVKSYSREGKRRTKWKWNKERTEVTLIK